MPVYNGMPFIKKAIDSLRMQSFEDWILLISDNSSEDNTEEICREYTKIDPRIKYFRQKENIGAAKNFKFLLKQANSEFFMWASSDDVWEMDFIKTCINLLENNKDCSMAFCKIVNIDSFGRIIRHYPDFFRFTKNGKFKNTCNFLLDPEIMGKANLICSIYRLELCKLAWRISPLSSHWGSDMNFVLAAISRGKLIVDKKVLFKKRIVRSTDHSSKIDNIVISNPNLHNFPLKSGNLYLFNNLKAVRGTEFFFLSYFIIIARLIITIITTFINRLRKIF